MATITYMQNDNSGDPGTITLGGEEKIALSGPPNNGRLDNVGDLVFAEFSPPGLRTIRVECIRTSDDAMTIRVVSFAGYYDYAYDAIRENVAENVPIDFA